ncbi:MAG: hypothetical protein KME04_11705 [Pleurocapsa minor GSE-CHR-MK-17-07R]|jgi:WD40 repeat protein|nr:hypothetical protein [Pleurocapsa minor GSE-CHR-MK 17-07R]
MRRLLASLLMVLFVGSGVQAQDTDSTTRITRVVWSPDGTRVATSYRDGRILIDSLEGQQQRLLLQADTSRILGLAWSPDGQLLASGSTSPDNALRIWDAITGEQVHVVADFGLDILTVTWSPNGQYILAVTAEPFNTPSNAVLVDSTTLQSTTFSTGAVSDIAWNLDGTQAAFSNISFNVEVRNVASLDLASRYMYDAPFIPGLLNQLIKVTWSSTGEYIAGGTGDGRIIIWRFDSPEPVHVLEGNSYQGENIALAWINELYFDDSGQYVTSVSRDGTLRRWVVETGNLVSEQMVTPQYAADFSPYGGRLALGLALPENMAATQVDLVVETLASGAIQIVVPDPSIDRLNTIAAACDAPVSPTTDMADFIAQVEALPADSIPPACAADLLAVARALESQ